ncbi:MAG: tRNA lysidine(34) synthetase TilS [Chitinophagaceae bacterium]|nr:MAG: tRNA lysidine(34) synthetase TilS [Chitinophagaceae bacterium]
MNLLNPFLSYIKAEKLFTDRDRLLVAVSGGVAIKYDVPFFTTTFDTEAYAAHHKASIQVAARELRYNWFKNLLQQIQANIASKPLLLTAHHADDNVETIMMNFFKGSGINGLKGILPLQGQIARPLLFANKEQIIEFAKEKDLQYREDSSNNIDKYTRNFFRNSLIPGLQKVYPQVKENLAENARRFREINAVYNNAIRQIKSKMLVFAGNEVHLPVLKLSKTEALATVLYEIIKNYSFTPRQVMEVEKLLHSESGKYVESATHRILRNRKWLIITPIVQQDGSTYLIEQTDKAIAFSKGLLSIETAVFPGNISKDVNIAQVDAKNIQFPLLLRRWKKGDYFYPLGLGRKKKIGRFLTDLKLSLPEREQVWVLETNKKIIWVVGIRIDDRFKMLPSTQNTLQLNLRPAEQARAL